jgi:hypothetical protein
MIDSAGSSRYRICPSFCSGTMTRDLWNGSFLVFRRLRQDVQRFHADTDIMAGQFSAAIGHPISGLEFRSRMIGRWPSGQPLMRSPADPNQLDSELASITLLSRTVSPT